MSFEDTSYQRTGGLQDNAEEVKDSLEDRLAELTERVDKIASSLADRGLDLFDDLRDGAEDAAGNALTVTRRAMHHMQEETSHIAETARENPIAAATVLTSVAAFGLAIGYLVGTAASDRHRYW